MVAGARANSIQMRLNYKATKRPEKKKSSFWTDNNQSYYRTGHSSSAQ